MPHFLSPNFPFISSFWLLFYLDILYSNEALLDIGETVSQHQRNTIKTLEKNLKGARANCLAADIP